jgi:hypothetical protein
MTISDQSAHLPKQYTGDGATVAFATGFTFYDSSEIQVVERVTATGVETVKTITTHYTVGGGSGSTGTVTAVTAPASTVTWTIRRISPLTQTADYVQGDAFSPSAHEDTLDKGALRDQDIREILNRSLHFPRSDLRTLSAEIPDSVARANTYLGFDADGEPTAIAAAASSVGVSTFMATVLDDTSAVLAAATLEVIPLTAVGVTVQAYDADLLAIAALTHVSGSVIRSNGSAWLRAVLAGADVSYSPTTSGLVATTVQAAIDERIRTLTKKTSDEADAGSETVVAGLSNLAMPGTPNSSRKYRAMGQLLVTGSSTDVVVLARVRVGPLGTASDPIVWEASSRIASAIAQIEETFVIFIPEFTPASGDKLSVTFSGGTFTIRGDATVLESYIEISMI